MIKKAERERQGKYLNTGCGQNVQLNDADRAKLLNGRGRRKTSRWSTTVFSFDSALQFTIPVLSYAADVRVIKGPRISNRRRLNRKTCIKTEIQDASIFATAEMHL